MKKLTLSILALLALTLTGCVDNRTQEQKQRQIDDEISSCITVFNYKGHKYLYFHKYDGHREGIAGITHDPDCPCREKGGSDD